MRYVYKVSDLKPGEGMLQRGIPEEICGAMLHAAAQSFARQYARAHPGDRAVMLTVMIDATVDYVPASVALPAKKGRKA